jgi:hypothetical protein
VHAGCSASTRDAPLKVCRGWIAAKHLPDLQSLVHAEGGRDVVLDLAELSLVDADVVRFLLECEARGIRLTHCPAYIPEWMARDSPCDF